MKLFSKSFEERCLLEKRQHPENFYCLSNSKKPAGRIPPQVFYVVLRQGFRRGARYRSWPAPPPARGHGRDRGLRP
ncbi:hypothetical protein F1542_07485 [Komagataeibacter sp. FXV3]|nr:hypothetical protein [Komagataeibacter sp. FXV3]